MTPSTEHYSDIHIKNRVLGGSYGVTNWLLIHYLRGKYSQYRPKTLRN